MYIEVGCYLKIGSYYKNRNEKRKPGLHSSFRWLAFVCDNKKVAKINGLSIKSQKKKNHQWLISPPLFNSFLLPTEQSKWTMMFLLEPCALGTQPFNNRLWSDRERTTIEGSILWPRHSICFLTSEWVQPDRKWLKGRWCSHLWKTVPWAA